MTVTEPHYEGAITVLVRVSRACENYMSVCSHDYISTNPRESECVITTSGVISPSEKPVMRPITSNTKRAEVTRVR